MNLPKLEQLKQRLIATDDFPTVMNEFLTGCELDLAFLDLGRPLRDGTLVGLLQAVIEKAGRDIFRKPPSITRLALLHLAEARFVHGAFLLCGRASNLIYFADEGIGLIAVVKSFGTVPETRFMRFRAIVRMAPSRN